MLAYDHAQSLLIHNTPRLIPKAHKPLCAHLVPPLLRSPRVFPLLFPRAQTLENIGFYRFSPNSPNSPGVFFAS